MRPTSDKVRQALFNIIDAEGIYFCDLFGGTGAVGCEAMSRGAASVTIVEQHRPTIALIRQNTQKVQSMLPAAVPLHIVQQDAVAFLKGSGKARFDFIFCDPPYDWDAATALLAAARDAKVLRPGGVLILEQAARTAPPVGFSATREKKYGDTVLRFYSFETA